MATRSPADREWTVRQPHDGKHLVLMTTDADPMTDADAHWITDVISRARTADPVRGGVGPAQREADIILGGPAHRGLFASDSPASTPPVTDPVE